MAPDENQLLELARRGDLAAGTQLVERFYKPIYAFLRRLSGNDAEAADLTQRAFAGVWRALSGFQGRSSLGSWMHSIAYHTYIDWLRGERHTEDRTDEWWAACPAPEPSPAQLAVRSDLAASVYRTVDALEPELRHAVHLHYYQELTLEETADALGIASSTVKYRLRQAVSELQKKLAVEPVLVSAGAGPGKNI